MTTPDPSRKSPTEPTMRQIAQNYKTGELAVLDVPPPTARPGGLVVQTLFSLISTGTELMKVQEAGLSLVGKARARPDQVRKIFDSLAQQGALATYTKAMDRLDSYTPLGYATCGVVREVGSGVEGFAVGDVVACAGNEHAVHADLTWVPKNLCVHVPEEVKPEHAAFATVGAIAMQGLRQAQTQLGESACVVGLGLIGQLLTRLLVANGVRVFGLDPVAARRDLARDGGALGCADPTSDALAAFERHVYDHTAGFGVDHVFLVASGSSNQPVELAARLARDRGRIVDIGKTSLDLPWNAYYEKELDVRFSRSYGPGRYDETYELDGVDYPIGYVRWTQRRNLECFLDLVASGSVDLTPLVSGIHSVDDAAKVYGQLGDGTLDGIGHLFSYHRDPGIGSPTSPPAAPHPGFREIRSSSPPAAKVSVRGGGPVRVGFIGAGNYASSMLLPHLARDEGIRLARVATTRSLSAVNVARRFDVEAVSTDSADVLDDDSLDAIFVVTRHHSHADFVCRALSTGRAVYVEKPLALNWDELDRVLDAVERTGNDRLMVGFNRRFAPLVRTIKRGMDTSEGGALARYLVNAGRLAEGSWYANEALEGSRFVGEGGHFIDTLSALLGEDPVAIYASAPPRGDDVDVHIRYSDGSLGAIAYVTTGSSRFPKETVDLSAGGRTARLDNYHKATVWGGFLPTSRRSFSRPDKGQAAMLSAFTDSVRTGAPMPIPLASLVTTTRATLAVADSVTAAIQVPL